jgi:hypothetical protein
MSDDEIARSVAARIPWYRKEHAPREMDPANRDPVAATVSKARSRRSSYGRQYVIRWDREATLHVVRLGVEKIGFHPTIEGARALATSHARLVTIQEGFRFAIVEPDEGDVGNMPRA